jgi:hypothetical protein
MLWASVCRFGGQVQRDQRDVAIGVCLLARAPAWPLRIIGFIAVILLLPNTMVFAPRVLARCPSLRRLRGRWPND